MAILNFHNGKTEILTSSWSARAVREGTDIAYVWGADGISWFDSATGISRIELGIPFSQFRDEVADAEGGVVDLTGYRIL